MRWALSLVLLGFVAVVVGAGTFAQFSDTEESTGNYIAAGTLDLKVDGGDDPGTMYTVDNVFPGWSDSLTFTLKNNGSLDGYLYVDVTVSDKENGLTEPEQEINDDTSTGELSQYTDVTLYIDDTQVWSGKLKDLESVIENYYMPLGADKSINVELDFSIGGDVGNIIQSDKVIINATWYLDQNPPSGKTEWQP